MELTNNLRKLVSSLDERKYRKANGLFKAEGTKCVLDTLHAFKAFAIFATNEWIENNPSVMTAFSGEICRVSSRDLERMSSMKAPQGVIAVYEIPPTDKLEVEFKNRLVLALDNIQDPGNLGTIIRLADWFGITDILCSTGTADVWNPKVVQATMGAISRVKLHYGILTEMLASANVPIYGTFLNGENIYSSKLSTQGVIVMGNEGNGISPHVAELVTDKLFIPPYPLNAKTSESLNVAVATAITIAEFRRRFNI